MPVTPTPYSKNFKKVERQSTLVLRGHMTKYLWYGVYLLVAGMNVAQNFAPHAVQQRLRWRNSCIRKHAPWCFVATPLIDK